MKLLKTKFIKQNSSNEIENRIHQIKLKTKLLKIKFIK
jgi:hypothetical protein